MSGHLLLLSGDPGIPWRGPSGSSAHLRGVAQGFNELGLRPHVACLRAEDHRPTVRSAPSVPLLTLPPPPAPHQVRELIERWWARRLVKKSVSTWGPPGLIYERYSLFCDAGARLQRQLSIPRVVEVNAPLSLERPNIRNRRKAEQIQNQVLRSADRVVVVSRWLEDWAIQTVGCLKERVRLIPNGSSPPTVPRPLGIRQKLGDPKILIGFIGSMKQWHGIHAIASVLENLPEAHALMLGSGPEKLQHPRVHSLGFIDPKDLSSVLSEVDIGIAPFGTDAPAWLCPLKLMDYRAHGIPIVATNVAAVRSLLSDSDTLLPDLNPHRWAAAIREQAGRKPKAMLRSWTQVSSEAISGMLPHSTPNPSKG